MPSNGPRGNSHSVLILTYHAIDDRSSVISVPPVLFRRQMEGLAAHGLTGISVRQAFDHLEQTGRYPADAVVLTFDDGYLSVLEHALPVMVGLGFSATIFLVTGLMGMSGSRAAATHPDFDRDVLNWNQAEALVRAGLEIGSHADRHPDLTRLSANALDHELGVSRALLEQRLQPRVNVLAYPYGYYDAATLAATARHYPRACTARMDRCGTQPDLLQLPRIDAYYLRDPERFSSVVRGGSSGWLRLRQSMRDMKQLAARVGLGARPGHLPEIGNRV